MPVVGLAFIVVVVLLLVLRGSSPPVGYDVSYPQCSGSYPPNVLFGVVGVNGGLAHDANPCLGEELRWAQEAPGQEAPSSHPCPFTSTPGTPALTSRNGPRAAIRRHTAPVTAC